MHDEIIKSWRTINDFLEKGKGFVGIQKQEICGFSMTHFRYNDVYTIGTETYDPHKQKGLSSYLSKVLIEQIEKQGGLCGGTVWKQILHLKRQQKK